MEKGKLDQRLSWTRGGRATGQPLQHGAMGQRGRRVWPAGSRSRRSRMQAAGFLCGTDIPLFKLRTEELGPTQVPLERWVRKGRRRLEGGIRGLGPGSGCSTMQPGWSCGTNEYSLGILGNTWGGELKNKGWISCMWNGMFSDGH